MAPGPGELDKATDQTGGVRDAPEKVLTAPELPQCLWGFLCLTQRQKIFQKKPSQTKLQARKAPGNGTSRSAWQPIQPLSVSRAPGPKAPSGQWTWAAIEARRVSPSLRALRSAPQLLSWAPAALSQTTHPQGGQGPHADSHPGSPQSTARLCATLTTWVPAPLSLCPAGGSQHCHMVQPKWPPGISTSVAQRYQVQISDVMTLGVVVGLHELSPSCPTVGALHDPRGHPVST